MPTFAQKQKPGQKEKTASSMRPSRMFSGQSLEVHPILQLQRTIGNQAVQWLMEEHMGDIKGDSIITEIPYLGDDYSRIPILHRAKVKASTSQLHESRALNEKTVEGKNKYPIGIIEENGPDSDTRPKDAGLPAGVAKKKAGVDFFKVEWKKHPNAGPLTAKLRLDYSAKFKKDDAHDPALADFRQNVMTKWKITAGPHMGENNDTSPMHDDHYSRADDTAGNTINGVNFVSNDNPGFVVGSIDGNDAVDYKFTAEQMIIDKSDGNKVIAKRGPHTGTIKGKHPRKYGGVPKTLS